MISMAAAAVCIIILGQSHWLWLSLPTLAMVAFFQSNFSISNLTSLQTLVPDHLRGRVNSVWLYMDGLIPMWVFFIGLLAEVTDTGFALTMVGIAALAAAVFFTVRFKEIRERG